MAGIHILQESERTVLSYSGSQMAHYYVKCFTILSGTIDLSWLWWLKNLYSNWIRQLNVWIAHIMMAVCPIFTDLV